MHWNTKKRPDDCRGRSDKWTPEAREKVRLASTKHIQLNDPEWLKVQYLELKKTTTQIAKEVGCVHSTVFIALIRFDIPRRGRKESRKGIKFSNSHLENIEKANRLMAKIGPKHWNWQGGKTTEYEKRKAKIKNSKEYKTWRKRVFERDNFACQACGVNNDLHAHHKLHQSMFPHLRFNIDNGLTLCRSCHAYLHSLEKGVNSGKPERENVGNPEPSRVESRKVQRLLEDGIPSLITSMSAPRVSDDIVRPF